jgi:hypothetical protein
MPLAVRSEESTIENQKNIFLVLKICQADFVSFEICQHEIWGGLVEFCAAHNGSTKIIPNMISTTKLMMFDWMTDLSTNMEIPRTNATTRYAIPSII